MGLQMIFLTVLSMVLAVGGMSPKYTLVLICLLGVAYKLSLDTHLKNPDSNVHGANMEPTCVLSAPCGPHVGPINLAIREIMIWIKSTSIQPQQNTTKRKPFVLCDGVGIENLTKTESFQCVSILIPGFMVPTWGQLEPTGPMWAPCWPHELCYLGNHVQIPILTNSLLSMICDDEVWKRIIAECQSPVLDIIVESIPIIRYFMG